MQRAAEKMRVVVPVTLALIFLLLYLNFRRVTESLIVMLSVPFALVGGVWLMWMLDYYVSVAVIVGFIALAGVARSEEHTSELQSLMRISYAVFCLKKKK